mmetsp:Transcript_13455/g.20379  ORF Transcript_13455/g.20379 Transcript_13455/m.20379 type:complete len:429 (-) Transcript_13455:2442-3728(-)
MANNTHEEENSTVVTEDNQVGEEVEEEEQPAYMQTEEFQSMSLYNQLIYHQTRQWEQQRTSQHYDMTQVEFDDSDVTGQEPPQTPDQRSLVADDEETPTRNTSPSQRLIQNFEHNVIDEAIQRRRERRRRRRHRRRRQRRDTEDQPIDHRIELNRRMFDILKRYYEALRYTYFRNSGSKVMLFIIVLILTLAVQFFASFLQQPNTLKIILYCSMASSVFCIFCTMNIFCLRICLNCLYPRVEEEEEDEGNDQEQNEDQSQRLQQEIINTIHMRSSENLTERQRRRMTRQQRRHLRRLFRQLYTLHNNNAHTGELFRLSMMNRDFNENDYNLLSSLDRFQAHTGATPTQIRQLPTMRVESEEQKENIHDDQCVICYEKYQIGDSLTTLPCFHQFHKTCVSKWLGMKSQCPICQTCCFDSARDSQFLTVS